MRLDLKFEGPERPESTVFHLDSKETTYSFLPLTIGGQIVSSAQTFAPIRKTVLYRSCHLLKPLPQYVRPFCIDRVICSNLCPNTSCHLLKPLPQYVRPFCIDRVICSNLCPNTKKITKLRLYRGRLIYTPEMEEDIPDQQCLDVKEDSGCFISKMADAPEPDSDDSLRRNDSKVGEFEAKLQKSSAHTTPVRVVASFGQKDDSGISEPCDCQRDVRYQDSEDASSLHGAIIGCHDEFLKSCDLETELPVSLHDIELYLPRHDARRMGGDAVWDSMDRAENESIDGVADQRMSPRPVPGDVSDVISRRGESSRLADESARKSPCLSFRDACDEGVQPEERITSSLDRRTWATIFEDKEEEEKREHERQALEYLLEFSDNMHHLEGYRKYYLSLKRNILTRNLESVWSSSRETEFAQLSLFRCASDCVAVAAPDCRPGSIPRKHAAPSGAGHKRGAGSRNQSFRSAKRVSFRLRHERDPDDPLNYSDPDDPLNYSNPDDPLNYSDPDDPLNYSDSDDPLNHSDSDDPLNYSDPDDPLNYSDPDEPLNKSDSDDPLNYSDSDDLFNYSDSDDPLNYSDSDDPLNYSDSDDPLN
ncbi:hypothetical protein Btru_075072 [Bulinus truncatus]|nr:hypothetical protein Btru_075072 [Bulinus truncatus]